MLRCMATLSTTHNIQLGAILVRTMASQGRSKPLTAFITRMIATDDTSPHPSLLPPSSLPLSPSLRLSPSLPPFPSSLPLSPPSLSLPTSLPPSLFPSSLPLSPYVPPSLSLSLLPPSLSLHPSFPSLFPSSLPLSPYIPPSPLSFPPPSLSLPTSLPLSFPPPSLSLPTSLPPSLFPSSLPLSPYIPPSLSLSLLPPSLSLLPPSLSLHPSLPLSFPPGLPEIMVMVAELQSLGFGHHVHEEVLHHLHTREEGREEAINDALTVLQDMHRHVSAM